MFDNHLVLLWIKKSRKLKKRKKWKSRLLKLDTDTKIQGFTENNQLSRAETDSIQSTLSSVKLYLFKFTVLFSERSVSRYEWINWQNF